MLLRKILILWALSLSFALGLTSHPARTSPTDLEVFTLQADGTEGPSQFYTFSDLASLPTVTVKTNSDINTGKPVTYTGIYLADLYKAIGADPDKNLVALCCDNRYKEYFDSAFNKEHHPLFLLKMDGKGSDDWPTALDGSTLGPYCVVYENFVPTDKIGTYTEKARAPIEVTSIEISTYDLSLGKLAPPSGAQPSVLNGFKIAMSCCVQCHNQDSTGGTMGHAQWAVLEGIAENKDFFTSFVHDPKASRPDLAMPAYSLDAQSMSDLRAYFHTMKVSAGN